MSAEPRFIVDAMLGKLAKWLRIMGYDTLYFKGGNPRDLISKARGEDRIILTRDTRIASRKNLPPSLFIHSDYPEEQLKEVSRGFNIFPSGKAMSRCSSCNVFIKPINKDDVEGKVPDYICTEHTKFTICPCCQRIYWPGSHYKTMTARLNSLTDEKDSV